MFIGISHSLQLGPAQVFESDSSVIRVLLKSSQEPAGHQERLRPVAERHFSVADVTKPCESCEITLEPVELKGVFRQAPSRSTLA